MTATFSISVDPARDLVRMAVHGFFTPESVRQFFEERGLAHRKLRCGPGQHLTLVDLSRFAVQAQDTTTHFSAVLADPVFRSRKLAFVTASALTRIQLLRTLGSSSQAGVFDDMVEAEAWLFAVGPANRAA